MKILILYLVYLSTQVLDKMEGPFIFMLKILIQTLQNVYFQILALIKTQEDL
jgi:hypothetical protein